MYKKYYQHFLEANKGIQHFASHSHHYWPDITREATLQYWDDSARYVDEKWDYFFSKKIPSVQKLIADVLNVKNSQQIVFAANTHEFVFRLFSCFNPHKKIRVLTTDSEFYSFDRQLNRLIEDQMVEVDKVETQPFSTFEERFTDKINNHSYDLIFFSQVFFNSGVVVKDFKKIVDAVTNPETVIVIDGYHAFMAIPTDLSSVQSRIFYLAGSYKYAQGGEGACFLYVPPNCKLRPRYTGWFAGFSELSNKGSEVVYSDNGFRFAGATMDFTALYRLEAVLQLFKSENIDVIKIHSHIQNLQKIFLIELQNISNHDIKTALDQKNILHNGLSEHGHFFAFELKTAELTKLIHSKLLENKIQTDYRGSRLRFGFGLYQDSIDFYV